MKKKDTEGDVGKFPAVEEKRKVIWLDAKIVIEIGASKLCIFLVTQLEMV